MWNLACLYQHGDGVKMNKSKAIQLSRVAADRGYSSAQFCLGMEFLREQNAEGIQYLYSAAKQGLTDAEYVLGNIHSRSETSLERGKVWLARAAAKGSKDAKARLAELDA